MLEGLNDDTLRIVNDKIKNIKSDAESKILFHYEIIRELQEEVSTFKKLRD